MIFTAPRFLNGWLRSADHQREVVVQPEDACPFGINLRGADYSVFGEHFAVRVPYEKQQEGQLLWANEDWFVEHGAAFETADAWRLLTTWLLDTFSIRTGPDVSTKSGEWVYADRYGGPNGTAHGGSGRCVYRGRFNVKGVGPTPLVPTQAKDHIDGLFSLNEGIRATIYAELVQLQTLKGAIRTVGIIGFPAHLSSDEANRCLLVRANFIRPSHAERSLYFGSSGFAGSDQYVDHCRVEAVRKALREMPISWEFMVDNSASQIGSLDAVRMAQGLFTTSNMSIFGEVADFDTFRAFDTWDYLRAAKRGEDRFGFEVRDLAYAARSWAWRLSGERHVIDTFLGRAEAAYQAGFIQTLKNVIPSWNGRQSDAQGKLCHLILAVSRGTSTTASDWITNGFLEAPSYIDRARALSKTFGFGELESLVVAGRLAYWRKSLTSISHDALKAKLVEISHERSEDQPSLSSWIAKCVHRSHRLHRGLGDWIIPLFVSASNGALVLFDAQDKIFSTVPGFTRRIPTLRNCSSDHAMSLALEEDTDRGNDHQSSIVVTIRRITNI